MTKSSLQLQRERDLIARNLLAVKKAATKKGLTREAVDIAKQLRAVYDRLGKDVADAKEQEYREWERKNPPVVTTAQQAEYERSEIDLGGPTAKWSIRGVLQVGRGCIICGYHLIRPGSGGVGYASINASGYLCRKCLSAYTHRHHGDTLEVLALTVRDRLMQERPDVLPANIAHDEYPVSWQRYTWAHRLAGVDRGILADQEPMKRPFDYLATPTTRSPAGHGGTEEE